MSSMSAEGRYEALTYERSPYLKRAREAARLTIPGLMPPEGDRTSGDLHMPFQSVGARGVNNLGNKLIVALFPPGTSFFRLGLDDYVIRELSEQLQGEGVEDAIAEFEAALSRVEKAVVNRLEQRGARTTLLEVIRHLIVCGNALLQVQPDGSLRMHPLSHYTCKRDKSGNVIEIVVKESVSLMTLPDAARQIVEDSSDAMPEDKDGSNSLDIFTRISRREKHWAIHQEIKGEVIPDTEGTYPLEKSPWVALRWTKIDGEDYGRGFIEEFFGDLRSLESLSQSIVEISAAAAKILLFVDESGLTSRDEVADADSGDVLDGNAKDISVFQLDKLSDFRVTKDTLDTIEKRLEQAFMLLSGMQRNAERVTAEEIRTIANELEQGLGGVYSILSQELQAPLVRRVMLQMEKEGSIPALPEKAVNPKIITGMEALGRNTDLMKLDMFIGGAVSILGDAIHQYINAGSYLKRRAAALSLDVEGLVRSEEEVQAQRQAGMEQQMIEKLGPSGIKAMSDQSKE
jgi:hypothetical protein